MLFTPSTNIPFSRNAEDSWRGICNKTVGMFLKLLRAMISQFTHKAGSRFTQLETAHRMPPPGLCQCSSHSS